MRALAVALLVLGASLAHAELPCGGPASVPYRIRWKPAAKGGPVTGYRLYREPTGGHATWSREDLAPPVELGLPQPGADGIFAQAVIGFSATAATFIVLTAVGPGGESSVSNELQIPPVSSGACPPAPAAPVLLDATPQ